MLCNRFFFIMEIVFCSDTSSEIECANDENNAEIEVLYICYIFFIQDS